MLRYAATIFLSAFLLFQVQPLIAKVILPWFGGSPSVWSTCMLFFQVLLLGGYCYAHILTAKLEGRTQALVHTALLVVALGTLPILPDAYWKPAGGEDPTFRILLLLLVTIGLPYFLLSSTGPLVQRWFSVAYPGRSPYRLYSLSNIGSVAALLTFPFLFEPLFTGGALAWSWSVLFGVFAILCGVTAWKALGSRAAEAPALDEVPKNKQLAPVGGRRIGLWLALAALPSVMLLAITNVLCQDIAVVPFLWVAPLTIYLVTFILCFDSDRWYRRRIFAPALGIVGPLALVVTYLVEKEVHNALTALPMQIVIFSALLFLCGMVCHGELVRRKPEAGRLTLFYVCVSAGGALGGVFVALIAPLVFTNYVELWLGAAACTVAALYVLFESGFVRRSNPGARWALPGAMAVALLVSLTLHILDRDTALISSSRGFFGRTRVYEYVSVQGEGAQAQGDRRAQPHARPHPARAAVLRRQAALPPHHLLHRGVRHRHRDGLRPRGHRAAAREDERTGAHRHHRTRRRHDRLLRREG